MRVALLALSACGRIGFDPTAPSDGGGADVALPIAAAVEAESCALVDPFVVISDPTASGGAYVRDDNQRGICGMGSAACTFSLATSGTYYLWMRTITIDTATDSFFVAIDGGSPMAYENDDCVYGSQWHWGGLRPAHACPVLTPIAPIALAAGSHVMTLSSREGQSIVDRVELVTDAAYVPSG